MFEIMINDYYVKPLIISSYKRIFCIERLFDEISKFEFKEKYIFKSSYNNVNGLYKVAIIFLVGEKDKMQLRRKIKNLKDLCKDIELSPYVLKEYPLSYDKDKIPSPNYHFSEYEIKTMEEFKLKENLMVTQY